MILGRGCLLIERMRVKPKKDKKQKAVSKKKADFDIEKSEEPIQQGILPDRDFKRNIGCG